MTGGVPTLAQARLIAARGWPESPPQPCGKAPATTHGFHDASRDLAQIAPPARSGSLR